MQPRTTQADRGNVPGGNRVTFKITKEQIEKLSAVIGTVPTSVGMVAVDTLREVLRNPLPEPTEKSTSPES